MLGGHHGFDCLASSLIMPPNFGSGVGNCLPLMVVVALGDPGVPVVSIFSPRAQGAASRAVASTAAGASGITDDLSLFVFMCSLVQSMSSSCRCFLLRFCSGTAFANRVAEPS